MLLTADIVLFSLFCLTFLIQLYFYLFLFRRLAYYEKPEGISLPPASIIICARSEQNNLSQHLSSVLDQNYPEYEVVVVDDCSYDNTGEVLEKFSGQYDHLKIATIKEDKYYTHGKKLAQLVGIKGAKYEHLLFTDADCKPVDKEWLRNMMNHFTNSETEIVLGYGAYEKTEGWLNKLIRFDAFYIALQYLSFALADKPYMGVGRNLAYKKSLFFRNRGFASHHHLESGDDDLFVNETATKNNCRIEIGKTSHTVSKPKTSYADWIKQKRRHITTGRHYHAGIKLWLGVLTVVPYLFFTLFVLLLVSQTHFLIAVLSVFLARYVVQMTIFSLVMKKLGEKDLLLFSPVLELELLFFYPIFLFANAFSWKKNKWRN